MIEKKVILLVASISSIPLWDLLYYYGLIGDSTLTVLGILSILVFSFSSYQLLINFKFESSYFKFFFLVFLLYEAFIIFRGWSFTYNDIKNYVLAGYIFWPFIIPLFVFFDKRLSTIGLLIKWIYYLGMFFLIIFLLLPKLLLNRVSAELLASSVYACGFILLNARYLSNRRVTLTFVLVLVSLLSLTYVARRNGIVTISGFILAGYFVNMWHKSKTFIYRYFPIIVVCTVVFMLSLNSFTSTLSSKLQKRITEDTRSTLFRSFFYEMRNSMTFGKGMGGSYYFPMEEDVLEDVTESATVYRHIIENGYLQLLLTGGIIHIALIIFVLLPAAIIGIFKSANQFTMACGVAIFLWILDMFIYGLPRLSLHYILIWICVGICFKTSIRMMTNEEIQAEFSKANL
jgi:hypothetical protein